MLDIDFSLTRFRRFASKLYMPWRWCEMATVAQAEARKDAKDIAEWQTRMGVSPCSDATMRILISNLQSSSAAHSQRARYFLFRSLGQSHEVALRRMAGDD